jgi:hypothetical protein
MISLLVIFHLPHRTAGTKISAPSRLAFDLNQACHFRAPRLQIHKGLIQVNAAQPDGPTLPGCGSLLAG